MVYFLGVSIVRDKRAARTWPSAQFAGQRHRACRPTDRADGGSMGDYRMRVASVVTLTISLEMKGVVKISFVDS